MRRTINGQKREKIRNEETGLGQFQGDERVVEEADSLNENRKRCLRVGREENEQVSG